MDIRGKAYLTLIRPHLEYFSAIENWSIQKHHISKIEMVQRKAARLVTSTYICNILTNLGWPSLQSRRTTSRLTLFYTATHNKAAIPISPYIRRPSTSTRQYHPDKFYMISTSTDAYKYSSLPRTITDWNQLTLVRDCYLGLNSLLLQGDHTKTAAVNSEPSGNFYAVSTCTWLTYALSALWKHHCRSV